MAKAAGGVRKAGRQVRGEIFPVQSMDAWTKTLNQTSNVAAKAGIVSYSRADAEAFGREAAAVVNNRNRVGYTVYDSTVPDLAADGDKHFAGVGYGSGTTSGEIGSYVKYLRAMGYRAVSSPRAVGIILVGHVSWRMR
jgi:hypothetical protein